MMPLHPLQAGANCCEPLCCYQPEKPGGIEMWVSRDLLLEGG